MAEQPEQAPDWPAQITDRIVDAIEQVRVKTTQPAITVARGVVYGLAVALIGVVMVLLLLVGLFRGTVELAEWQGLGVWAAYVLFGGIFTIVGMVLWSKRTA